LEQHVNHNNIQRQTHFVAKEEDQKFSFLNIDINSNKTSTGTFYANEDNIKMIKTEMSL
jgi:hypothetical protein